MHRIKYHKMNKGKLIKEHSTLSIFDEKEQLKKDRAAKWLEQFKIPYKKKNTTRS